ncbi:cation:proton antiporter [Candidatus Woesearchaeota archaeon]|nr:cation:proton antiporter [Candidatus Woesearchaeota archaeon]
MFNLFTELALVLLVSFLISLIMTRLKQPLLIGYIITGVLVGPIFFNVLSNPGNYQVFAHIGVAFLLFIVGLQLNPKLIKDVGVISLVTGLGQIIFTSFFGFLLNSLLGFAWIPSILLAVAFSFSSTIIIVKLLSDIHGLEQLYGKISLGFLLVQDLVAVILLMVLGTISTGADSSSLILKAVLFGVVATALIFAFGRFIIMPLLKRIAHVKELLFLFIIAWCFGIAAGYEFMGFSLEIGALIAGVVLAATPYQQEISARIKPLKDFFIILFFIFLGTQLIPMGAQPIASGQEWQFISDTLGPILPQAIIISLFVLLGNPFIVLVLVLLFGYSSKTGFLAGLTVSQISEFSLIVALLAQQAGFLTSLHVSLVTLVAIITITFSTYLVVYGERIYARLENLFKRLERKKVRDALHGIQGKKHAIGIFGFRRMGPNILRAIKQTGMSYIIVDHDPKRVLGLKKKGLPAVFGDIANVEFLSEFDFKDMTFLISSIPDYGTNKVLLENYKAQNPEGVIVLTADERDETLALYEAGADYVIEPHGIGGNHIELLITDFSKDSKKFVGERLRHLGDLHNKSF